MRKSPQGERGWAGIVGITTVDVRYLSFGEVIAIAGHYTGPGVKKKENRMKKRRGGA
jgi:hypothetical protein